MTEPLLFYLESSSNKNDQSWWPKTGLGNTKWQFWGTYVTAKQLPSRAIDTSCDVTVKSETTASCLCAEHSVHDYSSEPHTCSFAYGDQNHRQSNTNSTVQWYFWKHTHTQYMIAGQSQMVPVDLLRVSSVDENNSARFFAPRVIARFILGLCTGWR